MALGLSIPVSSSVWILFSKVQSKERRMIAVYIRVEAEIEKGSGDPFDSNIQSDFTLSLKNIKRLPLSNFFSILQKDNGGLKGISISPYNTSIYNSIYIYI